MMILRYLRISAVVGGLLVAAGNAMAGGILPEIRTWYKSLPLASTASSSEALGCDVDETTGLIAIVGSMVISGVESPVYWESDGLGGYTLAVLNDLLGFGGRADAVTVDMSDYGVVIAGWFLDSVGEPQPCSWDRTVTETTFGDPDRLPDDTYGGRTTSASDFVTSSSVASLEARITTVIGIGGYIFDAGGLRHARVWTSPVGGDWTGVTLPPLPGTGGSQVNDFAAVGVDRMAVGNASTVAGGVRRAVRWKYVTQTNTWMAPAVFPTPSGRRHATATGFTITTPDGSSAAVSGSVEIDVGGTFITNAFLWKVAAGGSWTSRDLGVIPGFTHDEALDLTVFKSSGQVIAVGRAYDNPARLSGAATGWHETVGGPGIAAFDLNGPLATLNLPPNATLRRANHVADRDFATSFGTSPLIIVGALKINLPVESADIVSVTRAFVLRDIAATLKDVGPFLECLRGPAGPELEPSCIGVDYDNDGEVDLDDVGVFQRAIVKP